MSRRLRAFVSVYRLSQWVHRRFTFAGLAVLYLLAAAAVFGIDTQRTAAFQLFAIALALLVTSWFANVRFRPRIAIERRLPEFATVGQPFHYHHVIENRGAHTLSAVRIRDELAERYPDSATFRLARDTHANDGLNWVDRRVGYPRWLELVQRGRGANIEDAQLPDIPPGGRAQVTLLATPLRRGLLRFERARLLRPDVLGLINACEDIDQSGEVVVFPRCYPVPPIAMPGNRRLQRGELALSRNIGDSQEFMQLRDYRPGDPLRHIHWPTFAKVGTPVVKEFQDEYLTRYALVLDTFADIRAHAELEAAVSVASSFVAGVDLHDSLLDVMFVEDRAYRLTMGRGQGRSSDMLRELAAIEPCRTHGFDLLAAHLAEHASGISGCMVVLLKLDETRRRMLEQLRDSGVHLLVMIVGAAPPSERGIVFHGIDPSDIGGSLQTLPRAW